MKRFAFVGLIIVGVVSCAADDSKLMACYDSGAEGIKCVLSTQLPLFGDPLCMDNDGDTQPPPAPRCGHHRHHHHKRHKHIGGIAGSGGGMGGSGGGTVMPVLCGAPQGDDDGDGVANIDDCDCIAVDDDGAD